MVADDLEFGWYRWENGFRQKDGFFTDRSGNVLYWPTSKGPGYVMDEQAIGSIEEYYIYKRKVRQNIIIAIFVITAVVLFYIYFKYGIAFRAIDVNAVVVFVVLFVMIFEKLFPMRRFGPDLSRRPKVFAPRPPIYDLLLVAKSQAAETYWGKTVFAVLVVATLGFLFVADGGFVWWMPGLGQVVRLDGIVGGLLIAAIVAFSLFFVVRRIHARFAPYTLEYLVSRIKVREGLTFHKLWDEEDKPDAPEEFRLRDNPETHRLRQYDKL